MKKAVLTLLYISMSVISVAQLTAEQRIQDSVIGWWSNNHFDNKIKPTNDPIQKKRIEIALYEKSQALFIIKKMGLQEIKILQPNLLEGDWYLYLNKKHKDLIPKITAELLKMHKDGTIKRINVKVGQKYGY